MKLPESIKAQFRKHGIDGGKKRMASMTPAERQRFAMQGVAARKANGKARTK